MKKVATLIALAVAVPLLMAAQCSGSSSSAPIPGTSMAGSQRVPAQKYGHCAITTTVVHDAIANKVDGLLVMSCTGAAELHIVTLRLMWQDPTGDGSFDTEGQLRGLDTLSGPGMHVVSASCLTGNWKERALGSETGVGAELPVDVQSQVIHVVC